MNRYLLVIVLLLLYKTSQQPTTAPVATPQPAPAAAGQHSDFATTLARRLGNPSPSAATLRFIDSWIRAEGTTAAYNPLATSQDMPGATVFNSHGVKNYLNAEQGMDATVITLHYGYTGYEDIREGIRTNDPQRALNGLAASPWGTNARNVLNIYNQSIAAAVQSVGMATVDEPTGNPLNDSRTLISQGYGVGSHSPAEQWGGIDLVLGDAAITDGAPVYATLAGTARVTNTYPCGLGVEVTNSTYRVLYCHLGSATVADGQAVQRGMQIGNVGSSGQSSGPHLHYEVHRDGNNVNPLDYATR